MLRNTTLQTAVLLLAATTGVHGHSWIEALQVTEGGQPTGPLGYIRNYTGRYDFVSYRIEDPSLAQSACSGIQQVLNLNVPTHPQLTAAPGNVVSGTYTENGHISKPLTADAVVGNVYWFGTTKGDSVPTLKELLQWSADGQGGNKQGRLLGAPENFDDGRCYEDNGSPLSQSRKGAAGQPGGLPCHRGFKIPADLKDGQTFTVFWVWDYSGAAGKQQPNRVEWYTSCMDIKISKAGAPKLRERAPLVARSAKFRPAGKL